MFINVNSCRKSEIFQKHNQGKEKIQVIQTSIKGLNFQGAVANEETIDFTEQLC